MSHNVKLTNVKFTDLNSLAAVISEVSQGKATLDVNQKTFRTYRGQSNVCDACIKLQGSYDIGLKLKDGYYEPIMESALIYAGTDVGVRGAPLGLVQQEYALREAEYEAAQRGFSTSREIHDDGRITLSCVEA